MNENIAFEINELEETIRKKKFELASCSNGLFITKMIVGGAIAAVFSIFDMILLVATILEICSETSLGTFDSFKMTFFPICLVISVLMTVLGSIMLHNGNKGFKENALKKNELALEIKFMETRLSALYIKQSD